MSVNNGVINFNTSLLKVGKSSIYARIDPTIVKNLDLKSKQTGNAIIVNGTIVLNFNK